MHFTILFNLCFFFLFFLCGIGQQPAGAEKRFPGTYIVQAAQWTKQAPAGLGKTTFPDGNVYAGFWEQIAPGKWRCTYEDGEVETGPMVDGYGDVLCSNDVRLRHFSIC